MSKVEDDNMVADGYIPEELISGMKEQAARLKNAGSLSEQDKKKSSAKKEEIKFVEIKGDMEPPEKEEEVEIEIKTVRTLPKI